MSTEKILCYRDFGAVGDGKTNDFAAIKATHEKANEIGATVKATEGDTYYIGKTDGKIAYIKTNVDWTGATFIVDDSIIPAENKDERSLPIFKIITEYEEKRYEEDSPEVQAINALGGIAKGAKNIGYAPGYKTLLIPYNNEHQEYIRYGLKGGGPQHELCLIHADGTIDESTPFLFAYSHVSYMLEYRADDTPLTIEGGTFVRIANKAFPTYTYYGRGISVQRSNTVVKNIVHKITGEGEEGAPYGGFIGVGKSNNVIVENVTFQGHKTYRDQNPERHCDSSMGSYDLSCGNSNNVTIKNCKQSNFYLLDENGNPTTVPSMDTFKYWGVMGSNYCKNITYDGCELSRFDAHCGVYNGKIINSKVTTIEIIGGGDMIIENSTLVSIWKTSIMLRGDYGSTWNGNLVIRNCTVENLGTPIEKLVAAGWVNHYFGYPCKIPNVTIENLKFAKPVEEIPVISIGIRQDEYKNENISAPVFSNGEENKNPYYAPEFIKVIGNEGGTVFTVCDTGMFDNTELVGVIKK